MKPLAIHVFAAVSLVLAIAVATAEAQVYKWKDANGVTHYGEKPPEGRQSKSMAIDRGPAAGEVPSSGSTGDCATIRCQYERLRNDRMVEDAERRADNEANSKRAAQQPRARGMTFDVYARIERGMTEGEVVLRAGPPDYEATDAYRVGKTWFYYPTSSDPFTTSITIRSGRVYELDRVRQF
jgi:Domain of unknown function (DUF4124)